MAVYLLELYLPKSDSPEAAIETARRVERDGPRYVRTLFVAEDETCFHVFEAASREDLENAVSRAGLPDARVTEAIENRGQPTTAGRRESSC